MLEVKGVDKVYKTAGVNRKVLNNVRLNFRTSEFVAVLGPSGSGKTTLLNIVGGLDKYSAGDLVINEKSTKKFRDKDWDSYRNHRIGFVFQNYNLIPHQTVLSNVRMALTLSGIKKREANRRAKRVLEEVGLKDHINKLPSQLSGGQAQRVAIARALVNDPDILLADEPTGALDSETSVQIMKLLKKVAESRLVIMVTHNPELAEKYATRTITIKDGKVTGDTNEYDGKIKTDLDLIEAGKKSKKTRMSFVTALSLSLKNLLTKKARTILVAFAGSIGIIGIALISAVSTGFQNYIDTIERDTLTSYPLNLMRESTDITGLLLSMTGEGGGAEELENKVRENQMITSILGNVTTNDLKGFRDYVTAHYDEVRDDIRLIDSEYSVDPMIYTVDASGDIAKLNPSSLFTSLVGDASLLSSYSGFTSVYVHEPLEALENDTDVVYGRMPSAYNEMAIFLSNPSEIPDLLAYSLGFHDTKELSKLVKGIMSGEKVEIDFEPLEISYDELLGVDLRLILPADTYRYNEKYNVYEDMSGDSEFMAGVYEKAEKLKIVGIITGKPGSLVSGNGVVYMPSLPVHIIEQSAKTEIVKKQLAEPTIDVFSNRKFGEKGNDFNFEFSDLVSVDSAALSRAFGVNIDQNAISGKVQEYMNKISADITADITPVKNKLATKFKVLAGGFSEYMAGLVAEGKFDPAKIEEYVKEFALKADYSDLVGEFFLPKEQFASFFEGLLKGYLGAKQANPALTEDEFLEATAISAALDQLSIAITEILMQKDILSEVGGLTSYLTSSFSNAFHVDESAIVGAFHLNFSEEELARVVEAMFNKKETTLFSNLVAMGYQELDEPTILAFYFTSFDGKTHFVEFLDDYNEKMQSLGYEDKVVEYNDATGILMGSVKTIVDAVSYVLIAFVSISLIVSSIMIGVITYISVYERTKEIGILRAIGASKHNISSIFNAETFIIGLLSGLIGVGISYALIPIINLVLHQFTGDIPLNAALDPKTAGILIVLSFVLTVVSGLIPARSASKKDPVEALRSE
ncbi:ABC transporter ATP-binding protein/permease [Candidatus Saccharibacteria bacterium]|nr:ABC transporter ATP-binding protein/permease [Candidatus Saccharibacteria bacterium]